MGTQGVEMSVNVRLARTDCCDVWGRMGETSVIRGEYGDNDQVLPLTWRPASVSPSDSLRIVMLACGEVIQ